MEKVTELKKLIYDTLTLGDEESDTKDVSLAQQMGVSLTNAVLKNGVQLIQMQSVVDRRVAFNLVEALKILDGLHEDESVLEAVEVKQLPMEDSFAKCVTHLALQEVSLKEFQKKIKKAYVMEVLRQSDSMTDAAEKLGVHQPYLCKLKKEMNID